MRSISTRDLVVACVVLIVFAAPSALAQAKSDWLNKREAQFTLWQAAHADANAEVEDFKARTALALRTRAQSASLASIVAVPPVHRDIGEHLELWDGPVAPKLVVISPGEFMMGAPKSETESLDHERPQHRVVISYSFAVGKYHVTRGEFAQFVTETKYNAKESGCLGYTGGGFENKPQYHWENPGFPQADNHPVVCVNWRDANAYVVWLRHKTGKRYRLLSEAEWEYAARAGTTTTYWWGGNLEAGCSSANIADKSAKPEFPEWGIANCSDGYVFTSPVGSFGANPAGLYDMTGNAWQWLSDCWNHHYLHAPANGAAWQSGLCGVRVLRGDAWNDKPRGLRSAYRARSTLTARSAGIGFRVARDL
jgi:formylglycine-generating enzyme required for sulfatase activity